MLHDTIFPEVVFIVDIAGFAYADSADQTGVGGQQYIRGDTNERECYFLLFGYRQLP